MFCPHCGAELKFEEAEICPSCGVRLKSPPPPAGELKSTGIAVVASFFVPGLGQIYCGKIGRGLAILIAFIIACMLIAVLIGIILAPVLWAWNLYDAWSLAQRINSGEIPV